MQQELDKCKDCAEYGSAFCEECLKETVALLTHDDSKKITHPVDNMELSRE